MQNRMVNKIYSLLIELFVFFYSGGKLTPEDYFDAEKELRADAHTHYHTVLGRATFYEITATILVLLNTALTFWLSTLTRSEDKI